MLAYDYPLLGVFWTLMVWFLFLAWIMLLFRVISDIFRSADMGGVSKAIWALLVIVAPWLGVLAYILVRGRSMHEREFQHSQAAEAEIQEYIRKTATSGSAADELTKLAALHAQGVLTDDEFGRQKAKLLN
jgi:hypothetical protein